MKNPLKVNEPQRNQPSNSLLKRQFIFMETALQLQGQAKDDTEDSHNFTPAYRTGTKSSGEYNREWKRWSRVSLYIVFLLVGESTATLLGRFYYDQGGSSKWMGALVHSAGFPILIPLYFRFSALTKTVDNPTKCTSTATKPKLTTLILIYLAFGLLLASDDVMYAYGLFYLPVSTYALLMATQFAFNVVFSFFLNSQKCTFLLLNCLVLLTTSASLLSINADSEAPTPVSKAKHTIGFLFTVCASATYSLYLSLNQVCFEKIIKRETFYAVLDMQFYPAMVAACSCMVGLFASGEWKSLGDEMKRYQKGSTSYVLTLVLTAVDWQFASIGMLGLILEVSSLFSNVISTLTLPVVPILAVVFFRDKISGLKVMSLILALWGFTSYIYQNYLDDCEEDRMNEISQDNPSGPLKVCEKP